MLVKQVMSSPVMTCRVGDSVKNAAKHMWEHDCGAVPIVDNSGRAIAMLTDRDICMAAYIQGKPLSEIGVQTVMSKQLYACAEDDSLIKAEQLMQQHQIRRLPVLDAEGRLVGMLSLNDLVRVATRQHPAAQGLADGISSSSTTQTLAAVSAPRGDEMDPRLI